MEEHPRQSDHRNIPLMTGQGALSVMAWSMASPPIALTFLAVSMELPIFLAGMLVSIRHAAGTLADLFAPGAIARLPRKKTALAQLDLMMATCFIAVVLVVLYGGKSTIVLAFVVGIFVIGILEEIKSLMILEFLGDNLPSQDRMRVSYWQKAIGGAATIAVVLLLHQLSHDAPALTRHSLVVGFGAVCFVLSALVVISLHENTKGTNAAGKLAPVRSTPEFWSNAATLLSKAWFRKYILVRLAFVLAGLSVPFFALIAAEAHHSSTSGLTALVASSAAALLVAAPMWRALNEVSTRRVMIASSAMVAISGLCLIILHAKGLDHTIHLHAASLFVATIAVTGLGGARTLYFMDIAPPAQRITAQAVSKTIARLAIIVFSTGLAALAHTNSATWAVIVIALGSFLAIFVILTLVDTPGKPDALDQKTST
ncbi:MFS transporter [Ruegeria meonggei]|uniref:MFS transporter n=1 Tax=Ruegeria meonggei TaxID=1446476 RepID=UPI00366EB593